ncbi:hypothetical protein HDU85_006776 [Gaertneriomyces sp. JEL0708]|nr:hypothetical protein HDU85_006776 [Gaertneriomyces sp. JEL0708]
MKSRLLKHFHHLDAFPKVQRNIQHATGTGGVLTIIVALLLAYLAASEYAQYRTITQDYEFLVDQTPSHHGHGLQINVDVTIAMPCKYIRADVLDVSGVSLPVSRSLHAEKAIFETRNARRLGYHQTDDDLNIHRLVSQASKSQKASTSGKASGDTNAVESCRVTGSVAVNKVSGMLHFTALGHGYNDPGHAPHDVMNFTHRIDKLSFGQYYPGLDNPLDDTLEYATSGMQMFQYFIAIVPTTYIDRAAAFRRRTLLTNQYAVTDYSRALNSENPAGGLPGIFIKYDIEAISVRIIASRLSFLHFLTRLCGIIGGTFSP